MSPQPDLQGLTTEERELVLDLTQLALDLGGIIEPTPVCDLTNAAISLVRKDWVGAAISVVGAAVPYAGDLAKAGKIPNYVLKLNRAIDLAKSSPKLTAVLNPILARLLFLLDRIPTEHLRRKLPDRFSREFMQKLQITIEEMRTKIAKQLPAGARVMTRLDKLTDEMLIKVFGSTSNVGALPRRNVRVAVEFFDKHNVDGGNVQKWANKLRGVDLHAAEAIYVDKIKSGQDVAQYVQLFSRAQPHSKILPRGTKVGKEILKDDRYYVVGEWLVETRGAVSHRNLGVSAAGKSFKDDAGKVTSVRRVRLTFTTRGEVEVLRTKAAPAADFWTKGRKADHPIIKHNDSDALTGSHAADVAEFVAGGGEQIFLPRAYDSLILKAGN